ncbi:MAG: hypothetical protein PUI75_04500 [Subdoligranulum sp.]|nr:hypothetical protein [Subdoligranulum sp.]MDY6126591.1 hypothetical protein [Gemmiger qucibialis]
MITGNTSTGFAFALPENKLQDMRVIRAMAATMKTPDESDSFAQLRAMDDLGALILGAEKYQKLLDHVTTADGRQPPEAVAKELGEILAAFNQGKN